MPPCTIPIDTLRRADHCSLAVVQVALHVGGLMHARRAPFTDRVQIVLQIAREEASRLHHGYVGTEHMLLALLRERRGVAAAVLMNLDADLDEIRVKIEHTVERDRKSTRLNSS